MRYDIRFNVKISSVDDLVYLNTIMRSFKDAEFDVGIGSHIVDGKSLGSLFAFGTRDLEINTTAEGEILDRFREEIQEYLI